jgi:ketosteroid isomerase-like protein
MTNRFLAKRLKFLSTGFALNIMFGVTANANPVADANSLNDAFNKAFESCDIPAITALYDKNAVVIWPGEGEFAIGKVEFEKFLKRNCIATSKPTIKVISSDARSISKDYIVHFGQIDFTIAGPDGKPTTLLVRTSELLHRSGGKWRYAIDHASVGLPPPPSADASKTP